MKMAALGPLCAFGSSVTWALSSARYSRLSENYSPPSINFTRAMIGLPLFILSSFVIAGGWDLGLLSFQSVQISHLGWLGLSMVSTYGLGDAFFMLSTRSLGIPGALAIASSFPIWTLLAGYFFGGEPISKVQIVGLFTSVLGVVTVVLNAPNSDQASSERRISATGVFLALLSSLAWAINTIAVSRGGEGVLPPVANTFRMIFALLVTAVLNPWMTPRSSLLLPKAEWLRWYWLFALDAFAGSYLYMYGLSHSPLAIGSTLSSLAPVLSVPISLLLGTEKFSLYRTLGVGSVVIGIWLLVGSF